MTKIISKYHIKEKNEHRIKTESSKTPPFDAFNL